VEPKTFKLFLVGVALFVAAAVGVMWVIKASQPSGPRPGIDVPSRGM
jgi:hypothetical protein